MASNLHRRRTRNVVTSLAAASLTAGLLVGTAGLATAGDASTSTGTGTDAAGSRTATDEDWSPFRILTLLDPFIESSPSPELQDPYAQTPFGSQTTTTDTTEASAEQSSGLVLVTSEIDFGTGKGSGTGLVLTDDGYVVTNHHVVAGATDIEVTLAETGETYSATYVGGDATNDVAVLRLEGASDLTPIRTDTDAVSVGDQVVSVGDAGGDGGSLTAAPGEVTQTSTDITVSDDDGGSTRLTDLIEVTSDIVPGDSGGALLDEDGDAVGMNVAASSGSSDIDGYVIPISRVLDIAETILTGEQATGITYGTSGFLGVGLAQESATVAGVLSDGPAQSAGIEPGDTVTAVDGRAVDTATALQEAIAAHDSGDSVTIEWTDSSGQSHTAEVTLGAAPVA